MTSDEYRNSAAGRMLAEKWPGKTCYDWPFSGEVCATCSWSGVKGPPLWQV